jgi:pyruvate formate lyase activating enzyme
MLIAGFQKLTLLDYPDKIAALLFTQGCNFSCGYCHNADMIPPCLTRAFNPELEEENVLKFLSRRIGLLDGVVISGGEPTMQKDLSEFMKKIKAMGFLIKLDSNGSHPDILRNLVDQDLIDYFAMDIKYPLEKYTRYMPQVDAEKIQESALFIMDSGIDYEFRSTILPAHHARQDIHKMGEIIDGAKRWYLQNFRSGRTLSPRLREARSFTKDELKHLENIAKNYAREVGVRS